MISYVLKEELSPAAVYRSYNTPTLDYGTVWIEKYCPIQIVLLIDFFCHCSCVDATEKASPVVPTNLVPLNLCSLSWRSPQGWPCCPCRFGSLVAVLLVMEDSLELALMSLQIW